MLSPKISIVIPVYNRRDLLEKTLESIQSQTFKDWECLIVDDHSSDGTIELIKRCSLTDNRIRLIEKNLSIPKGPSSSRNIGLRNSRGKYIHFFDSDDLLDPQFYSSVIEDIDRADLDFFAVKLRWFHHSLFDNPIYSNDFKDDNFIVRAISKEHEIWTQNVIWRKSLLDQAGFFREDLTMSEDIEYAVRAMTLTQKFSYSNSVSVNIRRHDESLTFDKSPTRDISRSVSAYDAYHAVLRTLQKAGLCTDEALAYCSTKKYNIISGSLQTGIITPKLAIRHLHLIWWSLLDRKARPFLRLIFLGPVFWGIGFSKMMNRALKLKK